MSLPTPSLADIARSISVVIPTFNRAWELRRALTSLQDQTLQGFEVIVCDDGSSEDIASVVAEFATLRLQYVRIANSGGPARPRNVGVAHAQGEWVSLLDSDDWWAPQRIEVVARSLSSAVDVIYHPLVAVVQGRGHFLRDGQQFGSAMSGDALSHMLSVGNPIPNSSAVVRKTLWERVGGNSEDYCYAEDLDTWLKLAEEGARFGFIDQPLGFYWQGKDNISLPSDKQLQALSDLYAKHRPSGDARTAAWARAYEHYDKGLLLMRLGRMPAALSEFRQATRLRSWRQRIHRNRMMLLIAYRQLLSRAVPSWK